MRVLVLGSGGREHAIAHKLGKSRLVEKLYCMPGNAGISSSAEIVDIGASDFEGIKVFSREKGIDAIVVGPETPLVSGISDRLSSSTCMVFGPDSRASVLEGSKIYAKNFMYKYGIPTAPFRAFSKPSDALEYLKEVTYLPVIKADGLAYGKGVVVCDDKRSARQAIKEMMINRRFGASGSRIVIEERLTGAELTLMAFCDGKTLSVMPPVRDYKRLYEGDTGPNTGGMGSYAPVPGLKKGLMEEIERCVLARFIKGLQAEGMRYRGVIYFGMILTPAGPKVLEFNVRFGDPETQVLLPLLKTDLAEIFLAVMEERLDSIRIDWKRKDSLCIIIASCGYPAQKGREVPIFGIDEAGTGDIIIFHSGTKRSSSGYVASGGRVLGVTAVGKNPSEARSRAYSSVEKISFEGMYYRKDIGKELEA